MGSIFISYPHEQLALAERLQQDLQEQGYEVWRDGANLRGGESWIAEIQNQLSVIDALVLLLTPESVDPNRVCVKELAWAYAAGRRIIPLRLLECQPHLLIADLHQLDFRSWSWSNDHYRRCLDRLLANLAPSEEPPAGESRLVTELKPLDFDTQLAFLSRRFNGRGWLIEEARRALADSRVVVVTGDIGVGKSTLAGHLARSWTSVIAFHVCDHRNPDLISPSRFARSLAYQLTLVFPDYRAMLLAQALRDLPSDPHSLFETLLIKPLARIAPPQTDQFIIVDGIDEASVDRNNDLADLLTAAFERTPPWLKLIATTRPDRLVEQSFGGFHWIRISADDSRNRGDLSEFLAANLPAALTQQSSVVAEKSEGNFLIAALVVQALRTGALSVDKIGELPAGLDPAFRFLFQRYFPNRDVFVKRFRPVLELVAVAHGPLPIELVEDMLAWSEYDRTEVVETLHAITPVANGGLVPFHLSLIEWCCDEKRAAANYVVSRRVGIHRMAERCAAGVALATTGARRYLAHHALAHIVEAEKAGAKRTPPSSASRLWEACVGRGLMVEMIRSGLQSELRQQLQRGLRTYLERRLWSAATEVLVLQRCMRRWFDPRQSALHLLAAANSAEELSGSVRSLALLPDLRLQRTVALLAMIRRHQQGDETGAETILRWLSANHHHSLNVRAAGIDEWAAELALRSVGGPLRQRLVHAPLYVSEDAGFRAQVLAIDLADEQSPTEELLGRLTLDGSRALPTEAVEYLATKAAQAAALPVCLAALKWLGENDEPIQLETLPLSFLGTQPLTEIRAALVSILENRRVRDTPGNAASVCALVLLGAAARDGGELADVARNLAAVAKVSPGEICLEFSQSIEVQMDLWAMRPEELLSWVAARLAMMDTFLDEVIEVAGRESVLSARRRFVSHLCKVLRWVAAQSSLDGTDVGALAQTHALLLQLGRDPRILGSGPSAPTGPGDPLVEHFCARTGAWLAAMGVPAPTEPEEARLHALKTLAFALLPDLPGPPVAAFGAAWDRAWEFPALRPDDGDGSPWALVLARIAECFDVEWNPAWSIRLPRKHAFELRFPDVLMAHFSTMRSAVDRLARDFGAASEVVGLALTLKTALGETHRDSDQEPLVASAVMDLDSAAIWGLPTMGVELLPVRLCRVVPPQLAAAICALELSDYGLLRKVARDLCCRSADAAWMESVRRFRDAVREIVSHSAPRLLAFQGQSAIDVAEAALAPLNLILDPKPRREDFERAKRDETVNACAHGAAPELLNWAVEAAGTDYATRSTRRLLGLLVSKGSWSLLERLFTQFQGVAEAGVADMVVDLVPAPERAAVSGPDTIQVLLETLGMPTSGWAEGIIYQISKLARAIGRGGPDARVVDQCRDRLVVATNWQDRLRRAWQDDSSRRKLIARCLIGASLLSGDSAFAALAEELASTEGGLDPSLEADALATFTIVDPARVTPARVRRLAERGAGFELLVDRGDWDAVKMHLEAQCRVEAQAMSGPDRGSRETAATHWYRMCSGLSREQQVACLAIYCDVMRGNASTPRTLLAPLERVSSTLGSEYELSEHIVNAARTGDRELTRAWMEAIWTEASLRSRETTDDLSTLVRCAGAWLAMETTGERADTWRAFVRGAATGDRWSLWNSYYRGMGQALAPALDTRITVPDHNPQFFERIALGRALSSYGNSGAAVRYWLWFVAATREPWVAIHACRAFLSPEMREIPVAIGPARQVLAEFCRDATENGWTPDDPELIAEVLDCAISCKSEVVLVVLSRSVRGNPLRANALARAAVDVLLRQIHDHAHAPDDGQSWDERPWQLLDLCGPTFQPWIAALIEPQAAFASDESPEVALLEHPWRDPSLRKGLGWLKALLEHALQTPVEAGRMLDHINRRLLTDADRARFLVWCASWLQRIPAGQDAHSTVAKVIAKFAATRRAVIKELRPLVDWVVDGAASSADHESTRADALALLLAGGYRVEACLSVLERDARTEAESYENDSVWSSLARTCAIATPSGPELEQRFMENIVNPANRALTQDDIDQIRQVAVAERLVRLAGAPAVTECLKRLTILAGDTLRDLQRTNDAQLAALASVVSRLVFDSSDLEKALGHSLSHLTTPIDHDRLRAQCGDLQSLATQIEGLAPL